MFELLEGWLRHKSDMVNFEAARAICEMKNVNPSKLTRAIAGNRCISPKVYARLFLVTDYFSFFSSFATLPVITEDDSQVRVDQDPCHACVNAPNERCYVQY